MATEKLTYTLENKENLIELRITNTLNWCFTESTPKIIILAIAFLFQMHLGLGSIGFNRKYVTIARVN